MSDIEFIPNPIDAHVGRRVRQRRKLLGVTQEKLAEDLHLTFQQVQKYERGANRVSASKLYEIARSLRCGIGHFYEGLPDPSDGLPAGAIAADPLGAFVMEEGAVELAQAWPRIPHRMRRHLLALAAGMAEDDDTRRPGTQVRASVVPAGRA